MRLKTIVHGILMALIVLAAPNVFAQAPTINHQGFLATGVGTVNDYGINFSGRSQIAFHNGAGQITSFSLPNIVF
ncbi:hypothetical protein H8E50_00060 [bacterium]|nr:hypothetical protein [bacterium]